MRNEKPRKSSGNKNTFWRLIMHCSSPDARVVKSFAYSDDDFDFIFLMTGKRWGGLLPSETRIMLEPDIGPLEDQLANPFGLPIWSDCLVAHLWSLIQGCVQVFPAPLFDLGTGESVAGYQVLNVTNVLECVDPAYSIPRMDRSLGQRRGFIEYCIDPARTQGAHMFKYFDPPDCVDTGVTCSNDLANALAGRGFTGLAFIRRREREGPDHAVP